MKQQETIAVNIFPEGENNTDLFDPVPKWALGHVYAGKISVNDYIVYNVLLDQVDYSTGIWQGTAYRIYDALNGQISLKAVQRSLKHLHENRYIKSFHKDGQRQRYPIVINSYRIRIERSEWHGFVLNADETEEDENGVLHPKYTPTPKPTPTLTATPTTTKNSGKSGKPSSNKNLEDTPPGQQPGQGAPKDGLTGTPTATPPGQAPRHDRVRHRDMTATPEQRNQYSQDVQDAQDPLNFLESERERAKEVSTPLSPSPKGKTNGQDAEAGLALKEIVAEMQAHDFGVSKIVLTTIRKFLGQGISKERLLRAFQLVREKLPEGERQPGLFLQQNFESMVDSLDVWEEQQRQLKERVARSEAAMLAERKRELADQKQREELGQEKEISLAEAILGPEGADGGKG